MEEESKKEDIMCIMCIEILKGRMTISEGRGALKELIATTTDPKLLEHYKELEASDDEKMRKIIEMAQE